VKLDNLQAYVNWYLRRVIGVRLKLMDSPRPCVDAENKNTIYLPVSEESLSIFLGERFVREASPELLFSILIGLAYHECAHLLSEENHDIEPTPIMNLVCEANDFTFVPKRWPGSIPYTLAVVNAHYQQMLDIADLPLETSYDKLSALFSIAVMFLRKLRIKFGKQEARNLPDDHPLREHFEKMKPILREARRCKVEDRPALVEQLFDVFQEFWQKEEKKQLLPSSLQTAEEAAAFRAPMDERDAAKMEDLVQEREKIQKELEQIGREVEKEGRLGAGHSHSEESYTIEEETNTGEPPQVDAKLVSEVRKILRPLFFERAITRRAPSLVGVSFNPSRFYEIKTNPEEPKIRKDVLRIGRLLKETLALLCFDRSGSMSQDNKAKVCQEVAATMYTALIAIPRCDTRLLGFGDVPVLIKGKKPLPLDTVLGRIPVALTPKGGTDLPLALHECLSIAQETRAYKKLIVMLTDGDLVGRYDVEEVLERACRFDVNVFVIGVQGSEAQDLLSVFGPQNAIYIPEVQRLGEELKKVVVEKA
jgi:uncharacterized protein with von Willebrand factor type A (vWA) domain